MSSLSPCVTRCRALTPADLDDVMRLEVLAYEFPWTRGNFTDSLIAGYWSRGIFTDVPASGGARPELLAYAWAMSGVREVHLLNLTVASRVRGRGYARFLLDNLVEWSRHSGADDLWLEVRPSNSRAIELYLRYGFECVGRRPNYYPAAHGRREDADVMNLKLAPLPQGCGHGSNSGGLL